MARVTNPLYGTSAYGSVAGIICFRRGKHGPIAGAPTGGPSTPPPGGATIRGCFAAAKAAHSASPKHQVKINGRWVWRHDVTWPNWWNQWLIDHPECRG